VGKFFGFHALQSFSEDEEQIKHLSLYPNGAPARGCWQVIIGNPVKNGSSTRCCNSLPQIILQKKFTGPAQATFPVNGMGRQPVNGKSQKTCHCNAFFV
jgi:hypothetical protein